jgi:hypothetical protein
MLSEDTIRELSHGSGSDYYFDFSQIHSDYYEPLFRTLQRFAITRIDSLGFSCDELARQESRAVKENLLSEGVLTSIAKTKIHYSRNMIELLCYIAPKSSRLNSIQFSNLTIRREHLERLSVALARSTSLKSLRFSHCALGDSGVHALLLGLNPNKIESISIVRCGITGVSTDDILEFIARRTTLGVGLHSFEVSPSEIPDADRRKITAAVSGRSEVTPPATPQRAPIPEEEPIDFEAADRRANIDRLKHENRSLQMQIDALREMVNAVKYNESVYVVGPGAPEFVMYLNQLEQRLVACDHGMRLYP